VRLVLAPTVMLVLLTLMLTQLWFNIIFPAKVIVSYWQIISSRLYIRLKETCSLASQVLLNTSE